MDIGISEIITGEKEIDIGVVRQTVVTFAQVGTVIGIKMTDPVNTEEEIEFRPAKFSVGAEPEKQDAPLLRRKLKGEVEFHFFKNRIV